jgi:hypothetical protein
MRIQGNSIINLISVLLLTWILAGLQTTLWYQLFGTFPAPLIWLNIVPYIAIYRRPLEAILTLYAIGFALGAFTAMPAGIFLFNFGVLFLIIYYFKAKMYWGGSRYFVMVAFATSFAYHVLEIILSWIFEQGSSYRFDVFDRIIQALLTPLFAIFIYKIMNFIDHITEKEVLPETGENK